MLRESEDYARRVGDSLKTQVYGASRHVAQGFLDYPQNTLSPETGTLRKIYDNSLIVLHKRTPLSDYLNRLDFVSQRQII